MSLKKLFGKNSLSVSKDQSLEDLAKDIESVDYIVEHKKEKDRFVPNIDWTNPSNFSKHGSAEKYYIDAISNIHRTFPYDGSLKEKKSWHNNSSDLSNYIFENIYPRNNGYINIGVDYGATMAISDGYYSSSIEEYIYFNGTLNKDLESTKLKDLFKKSNKLDLDKSRGYNLNIDGQPGGTIEFYFKRFDLEEEQSSKQVIFDVWNSEAVGTPEYGRLKIEIHPGIVGENNKFYFEISSGSYGIVDAEIGSDLDFSNWHHYALVYKNKDSQLKLQLFVDGDLANELLVGTSISQVYGSINGHLGSLITTATNYPSTDKGWGKLKGSLDEFRYWKIKRTDKEIARNYFTQVGAGANTDDSNVDLGLYYKFNEGVFMPDPGSTYEVVSQNENGDFIVMIDGQQIIVDSILNLDKISKYDKIVLDYSGRISNGNWVGYGAGSRSTQSAMVLSNACESEYKDPVIYPYHPRIRYLDYYYSKIGREFDTNNNSYIYNTIPEWMGSEDEESGQALKNLMQIMAEFFDDLQLKIQFLPELKNVEYKSGKPLPFSERLLENYGFDVGEIFSDSSLLELFYSRSEVENYEEKIYNVKNFIYQNIYNNLLYIYRSKGTEKSIRNLLRCFGVDEEIVKINLYADNVENTFDDRYQYTTVKKKYVDFNNVDRFDSSVHQAAIPSNPDSIGYLSGSNILANYGFTFEAEAVFPKKFTEVSDLYFETPFVSCSLFGMHESTDGVWSSPDNASFQVFALKEYEESSNVKFILSSSHFQVQLESPLYKEVYENKKWNFAVSIKKKAFPSPSFVFGFSASDYELEFYGVNIIQDIKQESFLLTASIDKSVGDNFFTANKMIYVGAHRENFSGSVVLGYGDNNEQFSDAKISSVRIWNNFIASDIVDLHAKDAINIGGNYFYGDTYAILNNFLSSSQRIQQIAPIETLALYWDFTNVSSSDNGTGISNFDDGQFVVEDMTSGSVLADLRNELTPYTKYQYTGKGIEFPRNSTEVVQNEYVFSAKRRLPEVLNSDDLIKILNEDDEFFTRDSTPVNHFFALEKSMYQIISEDMLTWFGTVKDFNNLIGKPKYRYESSYKDLERIRELYFSKIQNEPDFEKFIEYYKWIDGAISRMVEQLIPASMNYSPGVANIVESHILERNKYRHKLPTIEFKGEPPIGPAKSINELIYNWKTGHAPISNLESDNCDWWYLRAEKTGFLNENRNGIFSATTSALNRKFGTVYNLNTKISAITYDKKRESEIIRNEVGFDLSGGEYFEITDLLPPFKDCDD